MRRLFAILALLTCAAATAQQVDITVHVDQPAAEISPHLYGLFFEDINFSADGGLYAELVQNRSFEYYPVPGGNPLSQRYHPLYAWERVTHGDAACELQVEKGIPLNRNNTSYLAVRVRRGGEGAGVQNLGFDGIRLDKGDEYRVSLYSRWEDGRGAPLQVELVDADGKSLASTELEAGGRDWRKSEAVITAKANCDDARLAVTTTGRGKLCLDMISLLPVKTFKGRENGLRVDLAQSLADLNPKFFRFPGGCIAHGQGLENVYRWKDSVGDVAERRANWNRWGYHQTYGLGYFEYFQLCEDIGATPLPVLPVGVSCGFTPPYQCVPIEEIGPWVQDAVDLIEFANGPVDSKWGKLRAEMGHPEPFGMEFICLGNEEHDTPEFAERFPYFVEAVRKAYPDIKIIGTSGLGPGIPLYRQMQRQDVYSSDEHYYESPDWFVQHQDRFDDFDRNAPKIFVGEYASRGNRLQNAVAEAAYLTGIERNADIVDMACYAPLFADVNHTQWNAANLIHFDKRNLVKTPNYYVQQLFAKNKGDQFLTTDIEQKINQQDLPEYAGAVGVGSWSTAVAVRNARLNGEPLDPSDWTAHGGDFGVQDGEYRQTDEQAQGVISIAPAEAGAEATYELEARKLSGAEGVLLVFGCDDPENYFWWNVGGWGNTQHAIEHCVDGSKYAIIETRGSIETDRWYKLRVETEPGRIRCYLDGELVHDYQHPTPKVGVSSTFDKQTGEVILKLVNPSTEDLKAQVSLSGGKVQAKSVDSILLTGSPSAANSIEEPDNVEPTTSQVDVSDSFAVDMPASSVRVLRLPLE
ncbi:Extracellular exo-alpha-L-arabinofuranosidase precursor [Posidoniimonas polymericola]|uniref:non-reducing end alpha-L-arabinofuranosidase n=1 Tax=Posidoniimonas polymericola TaxID=2528002 RepID=A0A5C5ZER5_9BACT|nr:alpha-L-arabinofuranosidase C-terminal domain-containing protein [Posidoniimonas polymericola]TWT85648.1 Extracellular exo-alpha-L-arabinofuranosidase precursor [Posidoniimonas polymericola]